MTSDHEDQSGEGSLRNPNPEDDERNVEETITVAPVLIQEKTTLHGSGRTSDVKPHLKKGGESAYIEGIYATRDTTYLPKLKIKEPPKFSGLELAKDPYAIVKWYKEVQRKALSYRQDRRDAVLLAIEYIDPPARELIDNLIYEERLPNTLEELYHEICTAFQPIDPGVNAMKEWNQATQGYHETPLAFSTRLTRLVYVLKMSRDPSVTVPTAEALASKFRTALRPILSEKLERHIRIIEQLGGESKIPRTLEQLLGEASHLWYSEVARKNHDEHRNKLAALPSQFVSSWPQPYGQHQTSGSNPTKGNTIQREPKKWNDLPTNVRQNIMELQRSMAHIPLGGRLTEEQKSRCRRYALCMQCRQYGHKQAACYAKQPRIGMSLPEAAGNDQA